MYKLQLSANLTIGWLLLMNLLRTAKCQSPSQYQLQNIATILSIVAGLIGLIGIACKCWCSVQKRLIRQYNVVDEISMTQDQFLKNEKIIIDGINLKNKNFYYYLNRLPFYEISVEKLETKKKQRFMTKLKLDARDHLGSWSAKGYILCRNKQMFLWMLKQYDKKVPLSHIGPWRHIVFESTSFDAERRVMEGGWFYKDFETDPQYSGTWRLDCAASYEINLMLDQEITINNFQQSIV